MESAVDGREIECAVLQLNGVAIASPVGEIKILGNHEFYEFEAKYLDDSMQLILPADLPEEASRQIQQAALIAFQAAGCEGLARVDFFYSSEGKVIINEINTMPGFTPMSVYPKLIENSGVNYQQLITKLIQTAKNRSSSITR